MFSVVISASREGSFIQVPLFDATLHTYILLLFTAITPNPVKACVNEEVVVSCSQTVSSPTTISSSYTSFIVGTSNTAISESVVDGSGYHGGVDLDKLTATAPASSPTTAQATITLLLYDASSDDGLRLGCSNTLSNTNTGITESVRTVNIQGAS